MHNPGVRNAPQICPGKGEPRSTISHSFWVCGFCWVPSLPFRVTALLEDLLKLCPWLVFWCCKCSEFCLRSLAPASLIRSLLLSELCLVCSLPGCMLWVEGSLFEVLPRDVHQLGADDRFTVLQSHFVGKFGFRTFIFHDCLNNI